MKKFIAIALLVFFASQINVELFGQTAAAVADEPTVEVFYFHYTRRCVTCRIVEKETENSINENFKQMVDEGKIVYLILNLEEGDNAALAETLGVSGQTLLVKNGDKKVDITNKAFMNARNADRLKKEVKTAIESVL
jgi:hypothetical protein